MKEIGCLVGVVQCVMVVEQIAWGAYVCGIFVIKLSKKS